PPRDTTQSTFHLQIDVNPPYGADARRRRSDTSPASPQQSRSIRLTSAPQHQRPERGERDESVSLRSVRQATAAAPVNLLRARLSFQSGVPVRHTLQARQGSPPVESPPPPRFQRV